MDSIGILLGPSAAPKKKKLSAREVGCAFCPLDGVPGVNKVFGQVDGKDIFIWGMAPGFEENRDKKEFIGKSGRLLWAELARVGIKRSQCDIQNVVRCFPADYDPDMWPSLKMRDPTKEEIHCCGVFTKAALERSQAKVHLVFGEIAAKALLGVEYKKGKKSFWSDKFNGHVVCLWHPSYFVRQGYGGESTQAPNSRYKQWRQELEYAASLVSSKGRFGYVKEQQYTGVRTRATAKAAYLELQEAAQKGRRVAVDVEDGVLPDGRRVALCCGFCAEAGRAFVFPLEHQEGLVISDEDRAYCVKIVREILADPDIRKVLHHGSYDEQVFAKLVGVEMEGFDYDTEYGEYFFDSGAKKYGLEAIADRRFPELAGYKEIVAPEAFTAQFAASFPETSKVTLSKRYMLARRKGELNMAQVPWKKLVLYNGADCDLTKRIEITTKKFVSMPLMHVYRDIGKMMARMEKDGPLFDYAHSARLFELYPIRVKNWRRRLRKIAENPEFNPGSPAQVSRLLFRDLQLTVPDGMKQSTRSEVLELIKYQHKAVQLELNFRRDAKILGTYLEGFKNSADKYEGKLTTKWWMTGTATGRLSSGAGKDSDETGLVNLQNVHSDQQLQNMIISDIGWRDIYRDWLKNGPFDDQRWRKFEDYHVFLGFDQGQFEIRVIAQRSGDKGLVKVFQQDKDIHAEVGYELTGIAKEKLMDEGADRVAIKGMHFGIVYGLKGQGLYDHLRTVFAERNMVFDKTLAWVNELLAKYFERYPRVKEMIERDQRQAEKYGFVETLFGFRRKLNVDEQKEMGEEWKGAYWGNQAANSPIQGSAHQLLMIGLLPIQRSPAKYKLLAQPQMEIHDAMYFKIRLKELWQAAALGKEMFEKESLKIVREDFGLDWTVPLKAEPKAGFRFGVQCKDLGQKGPKTTAEMLNQWCEKNKKAQLALKAEIEKIS